MLQGRLVETSAHFLEHVESWYNALEPASLDEIIANEPSKVAIFCVDVIVGLCHQGNLASPRVAAIVQPIADLFSAAHERGVRHFLLPQDTHAADAVEFGSYAPHCIAGTRESETVPELLALPFAKEYTILPKNAISAAIGTELESWIEAHPEVENYVVVGDCSDLCTYHLAHYLRFYANAHQLRRRVIVPERCVDTYDLPLDVARQIGAFPHPGDFYHVVFLHHMAQNGIEVVKELR
jgi:nicotinamidase-related amidase